MPLAPAAVGSGWLSSSSVVAGRGVRMASLWRDAPHWTRQARQDRPSGFASRGRGRRGHSPAQPPPVPAALPVTTAASPRAGCEPLREAQVRWWALAAEPWRYQCCRGSLGQSGTSPIQLAPHGGVAATRLRRRGNGPGASLHVTVAAHNRELRLVGAGRHRTRQSSGLDLPPRASRVTPTKPPLRMIACALPSTGTLPIAIGPGGAGPWPDPARSAAARQASARPTPVTLPTRCSRWDRPLNVPTSMAW
jgi:hypothetical protein